MYFISKLLKGNHKSSWDKNSNSSSSSESESSSEPSSMSPSTSAEESESASETTLQVVFFSASVSNSALSARASSEGMAVRSRSNVSDEIDILQTRNLPAQYCYDLDKSIFMYKIDTQGVMYNVQDRMEVKACHHLPLSSCWMKQRNLSRCQESPSSCLVSSSWPQVAVVWV